jgi:hypothetical protein
MHWKLQDLWTGFGRLSVLATTAFVLTAVLYVSQASPIGVSAPTMTITHILLVSFKPSASQDTIDAVSNPTQQSRFLT